MSATRIEPRLINYFGERTRCCKPYTMGGYIYQGATIHPYTVYCTAKAYRVNQDNQPRCLDCYEAEQKKGV